MRKKCACALALYRCDVVGTMLTLCGGGDDVMVVMLVGSCCLPGFAAVEFVRMVGDTISHRRLSTPDQIYRARAGLPLRTVHVECSLREPNLQRSSCASLTQHPQQFVLSSITFLFRTSIYIVYLNKNNKKLND